MRDDAGKILECCLLVALQLNPVSADSVPIYFMQVLSAFCTSQDVSGRPVFATDGFIARTDVGRVHRFSLC